MTRPFIYVCLYMNKYENYLLIYRNQSTLMITITGASVQEAIDPEREVLREEDRRGPAVR